MLEEKDYKEIIIDRSWVVPFWGVWKIMLNSGKSKLISPPQDTKEKAQKWAAENGIHVDRTVEE